MQRQESARLLSEVCEYIQHLHEKFRYDRTICIERSGYALYKDAIALVGGPAKQVPFNPAREIESLPIKGKRILLFDDSIRTGTTLKRARERLLAVGAKDVDLAATADIPQK
ncbi:MAG: phosphoribosyltransferase [Nitrososphaerota archaeon]|nr:phosphoribosyltransferase [Nitrososphaerota archaeon]